MLVILNHTDFEFKIAMQSVLGGCHRSWKVAFPSACAHLGWVWRMHLEGGVLVHLEDPDQGPPNRHNYLTRRLSAMCYERKNRLSNNDINVPVHNIYQVCYVAPLGSKVKVEFVFRLD